MSNKVVNFSTDRITLKEGDFENIPTTVRRIIREGWVKITISGTEEMKRAAWLEAKLGGLEVLGFTPTAQDRRLLEDLKLDRRQGGLQRKSALAIHEDYTNNIIPELHKNYTQLTKRKTGIEASQSKLSTLDYSGSFENKIQIDEALEKAKQRLNNACEQQKYFYSLADKTIEVNKSYKDGIPEYKLTDQLHDQTNSLVKGNLLTKPKSR